VKNIFNMKKGWVFPAFFVSVPFMSVILKVQVLDGGR